MKAARVINSECAQEIAAGKRFNFGKNWSHFLAKLSEEQISEAVQSLQSMLGTTSLQGKNFLDIGSGSGLFSLAAKRLGANVHSFDYDPQSVACTRELKQRFFPDDATWVIEEGSVLDVAYLARLGKFDVVYSWGVLHHTGKMWEALANLTSIVREKGQLFIAIYNDQGRASRGWRKVKILYNRSPKFIRPVIVGICALRLWGPTTLRDIFQLRPFYTWRTYTHRRGMSPWHNVIDWVGGYPFEVAKPEEIFSFYYERGFELQRLITCAGSKGCNEYVFIKRS